MTPPEVLVVDDSLDRSAIVSGLKSGGYRVNSAATFEQATEIMADTTPAVLVTEVRLGAFNGLHLVIRSRSHRPDTVAIIHTAFPDPVLEAEARLLNADYFARPVETSTLLNVIAQRLGVRPERRRVTRMPVHDAFGVRMLGESGDLLDVSENGFRVQMRSAALRSPFEVQLPTTVEAVRAKIVWVQRLSPGQDSLICGAEVSANEEMNLAAWRKATRAI